MEDRYSNPNAHALYSTMTGYYMRPARKADQQPFNRPSVRTHAPSHARARNRGATTRVIANNAAYTPTRQAQCPNTQSQSVSLRPGKLPSRCKVVSKEKSFVNHTFREAHALSPALPGCCYRYPLHPLNYVQKNLQ